MSIAKTTSLILFCLALMVAHDSAAAAEEDRDTEESVSIADHIKLRPHSDNLIASVAAYLIRPLLIERIDFLINKSNLLEEIKRVKFDNKIIRVTDVKTGSGPPVACGQKVTINLKVMSVNKALYEKKQYTNTIGNFDTRALNIGIIGMKESGQRVILVPRTASSRLSSDVERDSPVEYQVDLISIEDRYPHTLDGVLTFTEKINNKQAVMCGDEVKLQYKVRKSNGEAGKSHIKTFKIGSRTMPQAIELSTIEMQPGAMRTIIAPPETLREKGDAGKSSDFSADTVSIIEMRILE